MNSSDYALSTKISTTALEFMRDELGQYIDGRFESSCAMLLDIVNPSTAQCIGSLPEATSEQVESAVNAAKRAFDRKSEWRTCGPQKREQLLHKLASAIETDADILAELITLEVGAPLAAARHFEVKNAIEVFRYYAGFPTKIQGTTLDIDANGESDYFSYVKSEPVGVVCAVIPWNAPLMIAAWKIAPALAAGCTVVLKPSEQASSVIVRLMQLLDACGFPPGVVNVVLGRGHTVGEQLISNIGFDKISFTGSTRIGKHIHQVAAERMVRLNLELGGKSPVIVLPDANLDKAVPAIAMGAYGNSGQVCVSGSKVFVHRDIEKAFTKRLVDFADAIKVGDGFDDDAVLGPLISQSQYDRVTGYLNLALSDGGTIITNVDDLPAKGYFVRPTVITGLIQSSRLLAEEIFGPVITIVPYDDLEELVDQINEDNYGLAAMVWSESHRHVSHLTKVLRVGAVFVNTSAFPPASVPTGGFRQSGIGRDLGASGLEGYLEKKSVIARI